MTEGLNDQEQYEAEKFRSRATEASEAAETLESGAKEAWDQWEKSEPKIAHDPVMDNAAELSRSQWHAENERDAALWRAKEHVDEHLPEYKQTAAEEMKAETGQEFIPRTDDAGPVPPAGPAAPETPDQI